LVSPVYMIFPKKEFGKNELWAKFYFCSIKRFLHKLHYLLRSLQSAACWHEIKYIFMKLISYFVIITCNLHCKRSTPTPFSDTGRTVAQYLIEKSLQHASLSMYRNASATPFENWAIRLGVPCRMRLHISIHDNKPNPSKC
jgi:hypothetical protein